MLPNNLNSELLSVDELLSQLRQKGVDEIALVRRCFLEGDGHISVITTERSDQTQNRPSDPANGG